MPLFLFLALSLNSSLNIDPAPQVSIKSVEVGWPIQQFRYMYIKLLSEFGVGFAPSNSPDDEPLLALLTRWPFSVFLF